MKNNTLKRILSGIMATGMAMSLIPTVSFAAQSNEYVDPADRWVEANGRTDELDINATTTYETFYCPVCDMDTTSLVYRVPEYTKSGDSALNREVMYSDGTKIGGEGTGNVDSGTPGVDAYFTGYHWTKAVCQNCGVMNSVNGTGCYSFGKNVYIINSCDHNFFLDFDNTTYTPYNSKYHTTVLKKGQYCQFCKGTHARATNEQELHNFDETVDAQLGNQRFHVTGTCEDCGYIKDEYAVAKSVVESYYGKVDGKAHTVIVSDLSEDGVNTSIRYGTEAGECDYTSAPNYTDEGYYPVYYEITYSYDGTSMTENGVSYVWLLDTDETAGNLNEVEIPHVHDYRYLETVRPTCTELGYDRFQCDGCRALQKTNYVPSNGHDYDEITIREASCQQGGFILNMCLDCGEHYTENTSMTDHNYDTNTVASTCTMNGYTEHICEDCGYKYITDLTPLAKHDYSIKITEATCKTKGFTKYTCENCDHAYVSDYTDATGHDWDEGHTVTSSTCVSEGVIEYHCENCDEKMIAAESATGHTFGDDPTCTEPQICTECGAVLRTATGHNYIAEKTEPTCTSAGYTTYTCEACGHEYITDYTDRTEHSYNTEVTEATCTAMGYTTYTCADCGDNYVSDYTDKAAHNYNAEVTAPTCTEMGHTTYTCVDCGDSYISDYTEVLPHNYNKKTIEPTCTSQGYTIYTCPDCGKEYIGDEKESIEHEYTAVVTAPTCTEMGYTTYTCRDCDESYVGNYVDALGHDYLEVVVAPTCSEHGYTVFTCKACEDSYTGNETAKAPHNYATETVVPTCTELGYTIFTCINCDDTYKGEFVEALGHRNSEWIIDISATIEQAGEKHIECTVCGTALKTEAIPQLIDKDNSDEDGNAKVGRYSIILTDKDGKPVFDSEITININDNITINLPENRLLDYADRTTVTVFVTDTQEPVEGLNIFIYDMNSNAATGKTDANGQLVVPSGQSSTGSSNGTVGGEDEDKIFTYVITVTDKEGIIISNCDVAVDENSGIVVNLPDGVVMNYFNRITVTVTDQNKVAQQNVNVTVIDSENNTETGITNVNGKVTLPDANKGITDNNGQVIVNTYIVTVNDEQHLIPNAFVTYTGEGKITVELPKDVAISYDNRVTVTVMTKDGKPIFAINVSVTDFNGEIGNGLTDTNGQITLPHISEGYTDENGRVQVDDLIVIVNDETKFIANAYVIHNTDGTINIALPDGSVIDYNNRITVTVLNKDLTPVSGKTVTVKDNTDKAGTGITDAKGQIVIPPLNEDITDDKGNSDVTNPTPTEDPANPGVVETVKYNVTVEDTKAVIPDALVKIEDGKVYVTLPDTHTLTTSNQTTVTVLDTDSKPVKGVSVTVTDKNGKKATKSTNSSGKITVPVKSSGGGGGSSSGGSISATTTYNVKVVDKDGKTISVTKSIKDDKITLTLPSSLVLDGNNYYTITVTDKSGKAKAGIDVTLKDKNGTESNGTTDKNGQLILPAKEHKLYVVGYEDGEFKPEGNMTRAEAATIFARNIAECKDENISSRKSSFTDVNSSKWYSKYIAYLEKYDIIEGYNDGTFKPEEQITRAEFVTMCTRFYNMFDEVSTSKKNIFNDVTNNHWASGYIYNATEMDWIKGYADGTFRPDNNITRAEVVAIVNRVTGREADVEHVNKNMSTVNKFTDLKDKAYWAFYEIMEAANTHMSVTTADGETWVK